MVDTVPTIYTFKTKPYKHQVRALKRALRQGYIALLWEPGTGKTKTIIDWAAALSIKEGPQRVQIVCPLSVIGVWEDEFAIHCPVPYTLATFGRRGLSVVHRDEGARLGVLVVNYDMAWRRKPKLERFRPTMAVADESHRIKKPSTRRSQYLRQLHKVKHRAILSGTPTPKGYQDIYGQWVFLNQKQFGTNVNDFKHEYIRYGGYMGKQIRAYRNVQKLKDKIDADADIALKKDCLDLPKRIYQRVPVILEDDAWKAYRKMAYELFLELEHGDVSDAANVAVKILRLQQITGGWIKSDEGNIHQISTAKLTSTHERLEDLWNDDERVVCFARFKPEVQALIDFGVRSKLPTYFVRGGQRREERDDFRRKFQTTSGPSLFVAQIQSGGLGITLHASAEVLFYSVTHALDDYLQACDRVHRIGQTRRVRYQHLVGSNTIDIDIYANLRAKRNMQDLIMANPRKFAAKLKKDLGFDVDRAGDL